MINKVLYLGPKGSYSDKAKQCFKGFYSDGCKFVACDSIYNIVKLLLELNSDNVSAILPIENSIEGVVRETQDSLLDLAKFGIRIFAEVAISIEHCLIGFGDKVEIGEIVSHPQAIAQCREYIYKNFKNNVRLVPTMSTSSAVSSLGQENKQKCAIGSSFCAELYGIPVIETNINDELNNTTRFVMLTKQKPEKKLQNKVSIVLSTENKSGALNKVLSVLEKYGLNMSYIDSRPSKKELGEYVFYIDFDGYIEDGAVMQALLEIQSVSKMFEILSEGAILI